MKRLIVLCSVCFLLTACHENFDQRLQREAKEYTENHCPQEPEPGSRLDSTAYDIASRTYTTYYSLDEEREQILKAHQSDFRMLLLNQLRSNVDFKALKDKEVNFCYVYRSQQNGSIIYQTVLNASAYSAKE